MAVVGVGSGALVAALPASAAAGAPPERTGFATGMTNATKTIGGAIASSIFAIALASTGSLEDPTEGHAPLSGYLTVWSVCAVAALLAAVALLLMPKVATSHPSGARGCARCEPTTSLAPRRPAADRRPRRARHAACCSSPSAGPRSAGSWPPGCSSGRPPWSATTPCAATTPVATAGPRRSARWSGRWSSSVVFVGASMLLSQLLGST